MIRKSEDLPEHIGLIRVESDYPVYYSVDKKGHPGSIFLDPVFFACHAFLKITFHKKKQK